MTASLQPIGDGLRESERMLRASLVGAQLSARPPSSARRLDRIEVETETETEIAAPPPTASRAVLRDMRSVRSAAQRRGLEPTLRRLETSASLAFVGLLGIDVTLALVALVAMTLGPAWALPVASLVLASRQRAIGNALHDLSHAKPGGSWAVRWVVASLAFQDFSTYRRRHVAHHVHLGSPSLDPDYVKPRAGAPWRVYVTLLVDRRAFLQNTIGPLASGPPGARARLLGFWSIVVGIAVATCGAHGTMLAALAWLGVRASLYHAIVCFTELSDHFGMRPPGILAFTRNSPRNLLSFLVHPHHDNFHLTHHLLPAVPTHRLEKAHRALLRVPSYAAAHHATSYVFGQGSVVAGWNPQDRRSS